MVKVKQKVENENNMVHESSKRWVNESERGVRPSRTLNTGEVHDSDNRV
jgi:hypothetical protein